MSQLTAQGEAMSQTLSIQQLSNENMQKIQAAEDANRAAAGDKEEEAMINQFRRDKKEIEGMIVALNAELTAANDKLATT